ncbi:cytochrome c oxidase subunit II [Streptomyces sp. JJ36]|uniref:cytochrome c oxidase subunit II n=1 Tax=Streptomyces sp. JJ36 TaxID=2736645 RepID=UPI001F396234|nr:cytochrome c oxidase subunit II [Streptomyces sp. JJ36]MCF6524529.1 cytochrome c oxidase subunit II [Streptomyces sp. JJ36]
MQQREIFEQVFTVESVMAAVVFVLVLGAVLYAVFLRRERRGVRPSRRWERNTLESFYLAGLAVVAAFLVVWTTWQNNRDPVEKEEKAQQPVTVDVLAFQWCWAFTHRAEGGEPPVASGDCRDRDDLPELVVPTGRPIRFEMTSEDVIHSFWVPELRYKRDVFPDHVNTFTLTLDEEGEWLGRCAEFCGNRHTHMDFRLRAVSPEEYETWLDTHEPAGAAA